MSGEKDELKPSGSDVGGLLADLLEGARRRNLSAIASRPMNAPGKRSSPGPPLQSPIPELFLFLLPRKRTDFWGSGRAPRTSSRSGPRFPLRTSIGT
jgi:hypothetical protein